MFINFIYQNKKHEYTNKNTDIQSLSVHTREYRHKCYTYIKKQLYDLLDKITRWKTKASTLMTVTIKLSENTFLMSQMLQNIRIGYQFSELAL